MERNVFSPVTLRRVDPHRRATRGVALVLVLSILLLITGFVLAFYSSVSSEMVSAKNYASGSSSKALADATTQLVIGTIRKATSQTSASNPSGTDIAWASQPGMIRTWDNNGGPLMCYKLFSSNNVEAGTTYSPGTDIDTNFDTEPALFTDLNAPVTDSSGATHYPIVDPRGGDPNPEDNNKPYIYGFNIKNPPSAKKVPDPAPMPVRWMYVLQDGTLTTPTSGTTTAVFTTNSPTVTNPIVGRIGYWTDDDTCKVNVNTASEGVYWDMPHLATKEDLGGWSGRGSQPSVPGLSICQPATGEYQRYAGHPATTSLSPILGRLIPTLNAPPAYTAITSTIAYNNYKPFYDLVPRVSWGGSNAGTTIPNSTLTSQLAPLLTDSDRLFASVDEFMFKQPGGSSDLPRQASDALTTDPANVGDIKTALEKSRFFLTAHNSSPEVTMFNTPRVSMWPVWQTASKRTVLDSALAFAADLTSNNTESPYFFTRNNSRSTTADYTTDPNNNNARLYNYLATLMKTPVPGFGGKFSDAFKDSKGDDTAQVLTNIYDYIRCVNMYDKTTGATPYTGTVKIGSGQSVWGGGEVLPIKIGSNTQGFGRFGTLSGMDIIFAAVNADPTLKTDNPLYTVTAKVQAMLVPTFFSPMQGLPGMFPRVNYTITGQEKFTLNGVQMFKPGGQNWISNVPVQQYVGRGMGSMISPRASLGKYGPFVSPFSKTFSPGATVGPTGTAPNAANSGSYPFVSSFTDGTPNIPLKTPLPTTTPASMVFKGGLLKIDLYSADSPNELLQHYEMTFPDAVAGTGTNFPVPIIPKPTDRPKFTPLFGVYTDPTYAHTQDARDGTVDAIYDVVRGVEIAGPGDNPDDTSNGVNTTAGDGRMIAALKSVPRTYYHAHQNWASLTTMAATGMEDDDGGNGSLLADSPSQSGRSGRGSHGALAAGIYPRNGDINHQSVNNPSYGYKSPYVPSRASNYVPGQPLPAASLTGVTRVNGNGAQPGDWDTGYALLPDGAHMNMSDIGDGAYVDEVVDPAPGYYGQARFPYVSKEDHFNSDRGAGSYFSPSRQVPSSMAIGSIPTGVQRNEPWQTLLFNPKPEDPSHPGRGTPGSVPPEHLIADLFWMPVVEPYPISQPFSTAGKVNMNYQIVPFTYIKRATGIYAVMKSTKMMAIAASPTYNYVVPVTGVNGYDPKPLISSAQEAGNAYSTAKTNTRCAIDIDETVAAFDDKFNNNEIFRSATQICEMNLVPIPLDGSTVDRTTAKMTAFWNAHTMSGDNLREKPYVDIYPRLTTKSNAYTVHFRVQVLQKSPTTPANQWVEGKDQVISENRGSSAIERYLDSTDPNLPDFATLTINGSSDPKLNLDKYYRYRVVSTKRFSPY